jgi:outer membrane protein assembly factor BamB
MRPDFVLTYFQITLVTVWLCSTSLHAEQWSRFRGPNGSGVTDAHNLPVEFGSEQNVAWKGSIPPGNSYPILADGRIFLTAYEGQKLFVICVDSQNGRTLWQRNIIKERSERRSLTNGPGTPTPVTDGENVYAFFSDLGLISFDPKCTERWRVTLGPFTPPHGMASSPILAERNVILVADQAEGSYIAAFDKNTGRLSWKTERPNFVGGYSIPIVDKPNPGANQIVVSGPLELASYSAETGEKLWGLLVRELCPSQFQFLARIPSM